MTQVEQAPARLTGYTEADKPKLLRFIERFGDESALEGTRIDPRIALGAFVTNPFILISTLGAEYEGVVLSKHREYHLFD